MTRAEIEYTLSVDGWEETSKFSSAIVNPGFPNRVFHLLKDDVLFTRMSYPRISYKTLTPALWEELTDLKFHRIPKEKVKRCLKKQDNKRYLN